MEKVNPAISAVAWGSFFRNGVEILAKTSKNSHGMSVAQHP
jgi:hypothetical protein